MATAKVKGMAPLPPALLGKLHQIGPTPASIYDPPSGATETPCGVVTKSGDRIAAAVVFIGSPPIPGILDTRPVQDVADIYESPYTLPLAIREASARATELRNSFYPTVVRVPDGRNFLLNGRCHFYDGPHGDPKGFALGDLVMLNHMKDQNIYRFSRPVTYFFADPA